MKTPHQWEAEWECPECHLKRGTDGHDPCLGKLPGVNFACCGHGGKSNQSADGYISFENGTVIRFASVAQSNLGYRRPSREAGDGQVSRATSERLRGIVGAGALLAFVGSSIGIDERGAFLLFLFGVTYSILGTQH